MKKALSKPVVESADLSKQRKMFSLLTSDSFQNSCFADITRKAPSEKGLGQLNLSRGATTTRANLSARLQMTQMLQTRKIK